VQKPAGSQVGVEYSPLEHTRILEMNFAFTKILWSISVTILVI
jgi:hypothetical protein